LSHIDDDSLELFALGRVSHVEVVAIEEHLLVCPFCSQRLQRIAEFAMVARHALGVMATELIATHRTKDGVIHLYVRQTSPSAWVATLRGEDIGGGVTAETREDAISLCREHFEQMFPEHRCGRGCVT
jgi:hypothetical protein